MKHEKCSKPPIRQLLVGKHSIDPQIIQVMNDHDLVLKPMVFWGSPILRTPNAMVNTGYIAAAMVAHPAWETLGVNPKGRIDHSHPCYS